MAISDHSSAVPLLADVPISSETDDLLARSAFARHLARTIMSMHGLESFAFGLCGPWGSGKSSLLNLVTSALDTSDGDTTPIIVRFNPWWFSGGDELLNTFLTQLGAALGHAASGERLANVAKLLNTLAKVLRPASRIAGLGSLADLSALANAGAEALQSAAAQADKDVQQVRKEIDEHLRSEQRRIVIVMDDIDRLSGPEICELLRIVKAVADFPYTVYLLAFDQPVVVRAIETVLGIDGARYLEKIIPIQIDIPPASASAVHDLFFSQLRESLNSKDAPSTEWRDFHNLFNAGLKYFLRTPRCVKRLTNVIRVLFPAVSGEVYWPDFVGIVSLMVFAPAAYRTIYHNRTHFVGTDLARRLADSPDEQEFHESWIKELPVDQRDAVRAVVGHLFPLVESAYQGVEHRGGESRWRQDLRLCCADCFDRYFQLRVPDNDIGEKEWRDIVANLSNRERMDEYLRSFSEETRCAVLPGRMGALLERAQAFAEHEANPEQGKLLFHALFRNADDIASSQDGSDADSDWMSPTYRLMWAMLASVKTIEDQGARDAAFEDAFKDRCGLWIAAEFLESLGMDHGMFDSGTPDSDEKPLVSKSCVEKLIELVRGKLNTAMESGELARHPRALRISILWRTFGDEDKAGEFVRSVSESREGFLALVRQARRTTRSWSLDGSSIGATQSVDVEHLMHFLHSKTLRCRAASILNEKAACLTEEEKQLLELLCQAIDA